jgi:hypothetical protein
MEVVITRRFFSFILAVVIAASTIFPASAWNKDSFISGGEEYEPRSDVVSSDDLPVPDVYAAPRRAPQMYRVSAADQAAAEATTTGKLVVPATLPSSVDGTFQVMSKYYYNSSAGGVKVESDYWRDVVATFSAASPLFSSGWLHLFAGSLNYTAQIGSSEKVRGLAAFCDKNNAVYPPGYISVGGTGGDVGRDNWTFTVNYDVSSFSSSAFSLDGLSSYCIIVKGPYTSDNYIAVYSSSVSVLVDGQQVLTLSRGSSNSIDFGGYVFSGTSNISTISFRWTMPFWYFVSDSADYNGSYIFAIREDILAADPKALAISFLDGQDVINAQNDKTKSDINKHEEYESQWTGSMTENFNALGFDSFSWSDSLVSGFSLFSGIFMDIWRALGGATILFTFPLLLGVALLLIGRISRSGGRSGSGKGGGDGG